jgi:hypothetical protein
MHSSDLTDSAEASWIRLKAKLQSIFTSLDDSDLDFEESRKDKMIERLQVKLGKTREELIAIFEIL